MPKFLLPLVALALCYCLLLGYVVESYPDLPYRVASHFDAAGQPNGWMTRDSLVIFTLVMSIVAPGLIMGVFASVGWISPRLINLPNRDYWLALERVRGTRAILMRSGLWFCCLIVLFMTGVHALVVGANAPAAGAHLSGTGLAVVAGTFVLGTMVWCVCLLLRFRLPPDA